MDAEEIEQIQKLIRITRRRLHILEGQFVF